MNQYRPIARLLAPNAASWFASRRVGAADLVIGWRRGRLHWRVIAGFWAACAVAACGGGGSAGPTGGGSAAPTVRLVVQTVDTEGKPVTDVAVSLLYANGGMTVTTGADGKASFEASDAQASVHTSSSKYYAAERRFEVASLLGDQLQLTLLRLEQATPKAIGTATTISADAATLTVDAKISVTDERWRSVDTLTLNDFRALDLCPASSTCIVEPSGQGSTAFYSLATGANPVSATLAGTAPTAFYAVRVVLNGAPGTFTAGRIVYTVLQVRLASDTWAWLDVPVRL